MGDRTYVWKFPEPDDPPLCIYVAFIHADGHYDYYTLHG